MIEEIRVIVAICMFAVAAFFDVRERKIHDVVWLAFGGTGAILYAFEFPDIVDIVSMTVGVTLSSAFWFLRLYAGADALALIALSVILPTYNGLIIPLSMVVIATVISLIYGIIYNIAANSRTFLFSNKKIFEEFDEPIHRKLAAFFLIHKKAKNEKFVFPAERIVWQRRKFRFHYDPDDEFSKDDAYVSLAMPLTLFFLIGLLGLVLMYSIIQLKSF
ncbi:prepilin peptidase [Candidatus Nitrosotenuis uzonensis]|uniref:prepilin peptidase n=1 Tax=Candidatus Nitrosotenuis uzonensis TaxID=1407055 RepID=UPI00195F5EB1|nr:prepilin peptidase [Candidatus Nitrosotenuis uzonensis]